MTSNCLICGKEFRRPPSKIKKGGGKFCSWPCLYKGQQKGKEPGYRAIHYWIIRRLGTPKQCEYCGTTEAKRYEWSSISKKPKKDVSDWQRLCVKCHQEYDDRTVKKIRQYSLMKRGYRER